MAMTKEAKREYDAKRYRARRAAERRPDLIELLSDLEVAYLAGLTDADGSIFVTHTNRLRTYYPTVVWAMTHRPTIEWCAEKLGTGAIVVNNHTTLRRSTTSWGKSTFKVQWRCGVSGTRAVLLCQRMLPHMKTKAAQAELVSRFPADERRAPGVRLSPEVRRLREELGQQISALNHA